jgi:hypothetical protein
MGKPFSFFLFFFFFFFLGLTSAIGRADVSSEYGSRAGQGAGRVTRGSGHARVGSRTGRGAWFRGQKTCRKLHRRVEARAAFSGFDFSGGDSS